MTELTVYIAEDGTKFLDKNICLEYEAERLKFPTESGIIFYDRLGKEIDINDICKMAYYQITNSIIAKAVLNKIRILYIKQHYPFFTKCGYYIVTTNGYDRIDQDLFNESISKARNNSIFIGNDAISMVIDNPEDIGQKPTINLPPSDNSDIIEGFVESLKN